MEKSVVIVGGTGGIGWETALKFLSKHYTVHIIDISPPNKVQQMEIDSLSLYFYQCDIRKYDEVKRAFKEISQKTCSKISVLVISAAIQKNESWENFSIVDSEKILYTNLFGTLYCLFEGTKYIEIGGCVVNVSSIHGKVPRTGRYSYDMAKAGIEILLKELAIEYGPKGIRINNIEPGCIDTPMNKSNDIFSSDVLSKIPLGYIGSTSEVAELIYFLSSKASSYINGASVTIDGGRSLMK